MDNEKTYLRVVYEYLPTIESLIKRGVPRKRIADAVGLPYYQLNNYISRARKAWLGIGPIPRDWQYVDGKCADAAEIGARLADPSMVPPESNRHRVFVGLREIERRLAAGESMSKVGRDYGYAETSFVHVLAGVRKMARESRAPDYQPGTRGPKRRITRAAEWVHA